MAKKSAAKQLEKLAAPFWDDVASAGLDRFFQERLLRGLLRRFREDRFAKVRQGGIHGDQRADLSRVFIDLDVDGKEGQPERLVASWMKTGGSREGRFSPGAPTDIVLGGPGQGKSTVCRFLTLIHASIILLTSRLKGIASPADIRNMRVLIDGLEAEHIELPHVVRLPIWFELRILAQGLMAEREAGGDAADALLRWYAKNELKEADDVPALQKALQDLPWLIVLDGLDEAPPAASRAQVRASVAALQQSFGSTRGFVVGSSRPQSYDRSVFGDDGVERNILPLTEERARTYTLRFAEGLYADEEGQRADLLRGMEKAIANPATAALMTNPLLVTIMASIVIHHGEPSGRRWKLFQDYYATLFQRETERATYASPTLRQHGSLIEAVHRHVGMSLQARAEQDDGLTASMSETELRAIVREKLLRDFDEPDVPRHEAEVINAIEQRLVLLVQSQDGRYGFELRSFQEFMAAWQLTSLPRENLDTLLLPLAEIESWKNVVLLVLDGIGEWDYAVRLCTSLDETSDSMRLVRAGARLALAALKEQLFRDKPKARDALFECAIALIERGTRDELGSLGHLLGSNAPEQWLSKVDATLSRSLTAHAAWMVLFTALFYGDGRVISLAERHWPLGVNERRAIVRSLSMWKSIPSPWQVPEWLHQKLLAEPDLMFPTRPIDVRAVVPAYCVTYNTTHYGDFVVSMWFPWSLVTGGGEELSHIPDGDAAWAFWRATRRFAVQPSATSLAQALDDLAGVSPILQLVISAQLIPWPLAVCLLAATESDAKLAIARRLRAGELGDATQWENSANSVRSGGLRGLMHLAESQDPLRSILVDGLFPPLGPGVMWALTTTHDSAPRAAKHIQDARQAAKVPWVTRMIDRLWVAWVARHQEKLPYESIDGLIDIFERSTGWLDLHVLRSLQLFDPHDLTILVEQTTVRIIDTKRFFGESPTLDLVRGLVCAAKEKQDSERLQRALLLAVSNDLAVSDFHKLDLEPQGEHVEARLLRAILGGLESSEISALVDQLVNIKDLAFLEAAISVLAKSDAPAPGVVPLAEALLSHPKLALPARLSVIKSLIPELSVFVSDLASPDVWQAAGLPNPPPLASAPEPIFLSAPVIETISIENLRAFSEKMEVKASDTHESAGQWLVFLGENASGKTTLLRAVAMALAAPEDAAAVPSNVDGPLRRDGLRDALVKVGLRGGVTLSATISGASGAERVSAETSSQLRPWVVAYGCRRGSANSGTDIDNAFLPFRDIDNLFDRPRGLLRASGWLKELQRRAKNNGQRSRQIFEAAREALKKVLLGAEQIVVENDVHVELVGGRRAPLALLSDGYLTTAGWVVDLMARWIHRNEERLDVDEDFCSKMEGVVLIDEIDLHLHPRWQERVIEDVRALFPRLTFIVTTHHPLTLRGARAGEIFILDDHEGTGAISAIQRDIPPGTRVDQLITGEWFNRPSAVVDADTRRLLDEHHRLILAGAKAGSPQRKAVEKQIRERLGSYADTSLERLAATAVAQYLEKDLPEPTAEQRDKARKRVIAMLERRDAKRG